MFEDKESGFKIELLSLVKPINELYEPKGFFAQLDEANLPLEELR